MSGISSHPHPACRSGQPALSWFVWRLVLASHPISLLHAELRIQHCNDLFGGGSSQSLAANGAFSAISCLPRLRRLAIEDLHCRIEKSALSELSSMTQVGQAVLGSLRSGSCAFAGVATLQT